MRFLLTFLVILALYSCQREPVDVAITLVDPLEKILPEQLLYMPSEKVVHVARGECATFQIVVRSPQGITQLEAEASAFTMTDSGRPRLLNMTLPKITFVGYVHEGRAMAIPGADLIVSPSRFYPDPLLDTSCVDVMPGVNQPLFVSTPIPLDSHPGHYTGVLTIRGKVGKRAFVRTLSLPITVYPVTILEQTLSVVNWHSTSFFEHAMEYTPQWWKLMEQLASLMRENRQNVVILSPLQLAQYTFNSNGEVSEIDFSRFDQMADFFINRGVAKRIAGGHIASRAQEWKGPFRYLVPSNTRGTTVLNSLPDTNIIAKRFYHKFFKKLSEHLQQKGWMDIYIQHIADEPIVENALSYISMASFVKRCWPECKIVEAVLTTQLGACVDVWVPQLDQLDEAQSFYREQIAQGHEVWFYTALWPQGEYANRHIRQPALKTRLLHWINFKYGLTGYLHWGFNFWEDNNPLLEATSIQTGGNVLPAGDAWIIYPYNGHLISSLRLNAMRDGIADYELLHMLQRKDSMRAQSMIDQMIFSAKRYDADIIHFRRVRKQLLEALSQ